MNPVPDNILSIHGSRSPRCSREGRPLHNRHSGESRNPEWRDLATARVAIHHDLNPFRQLCKGLQRRGTHPLFANAPPSLLSSRMRGPIFPPTPLCHLFVAQNPHPLLTFLHEQHRRSFHVPSFAQSPRQTRPRSASIHDSFPQYFKKQIRIPKTIRSTPDSAPNAPILVSWFKSTPRLKQVLRSSRTNPKTPLV